ncbi:viroplasmin family protein [Pseudomonas shirazensis]|uniref:ribonuclease H1 domain-containing protein n=1 Tax=Pseudomonas shirazensis TaxID=2745494 RepID=UPI003985CB1C
MTQSCRGNPAGIFNTWESGAAPATQGVSSEKYKSYTALQLAVEWHRQMSLWTPHLVITNLAPAGKSPNVFFEKLACLFVFKA